MTVDGLQDMPRFRSAAYIAWMKKLDCCLTQNTETIDPAHIRQKGTGAAIQPPDHHALPVSRRVHDLEHFIGTEKFWQLMIGQSRAEVCKIAERLYKFYKDSPNDVAGANMFLFRSIGMNVRKEILAGLLMGISMEGADRG